MTLDARTDMPVSLTVNGRRTAGIVPVRQTLAGYLREELGLTAVHLGCEQGSCGACTVRVDGEVMRACLVLAVQAEGCVVETPEGFSGDPAMDRLRERFATRNALQCGFCTGGMLVAARDLLAREPRPSRHAIREAISGHVCRCTGYEAIVDAIEAASHGGTAP